MTTQQIHNANELETLVQCMGLLPFFACGIPGFSIEEFTPSQFWFKEGVDGPWEWRMDVARQGMVAYGKLFNKKAGLVSRTWYPDLANYRRDGYDFDARYITKTKITETTIESPTIVGGEIHGAQFYDHGGGFTFWSENGKTCFGSITYESNGIYIGGIDGITLDPGMGGVRIGNGRNTSAVLTVNNFPLFVSSGDIEINATFA